MSQLYLVYGVLLATLILFIVGKPRYDVVALMALIVLTVAGAIPTEEAFSGFSHPAVITVAAVLIASKGLSNAGVVDHMSRMLQSVGSRTGPQVGALSSLVGVLSAFMNNIGALALLMPIPIEMARKANKSPSPLLMPLAFGSLLGGLVTLIGTPPNIIISSFRVDAIGEPFSMFDFAPVGLSLLVVGVAFISLIGWRLIPKREGQSSRDELFRVAEYTSELRVRKASPLIGMTIPDAMHKLNSNLVVVGIVRDDRPAFSPAWNDTLRAGDALIVEANPTDLKAISDTGGLELLRSGSDEDALAAAGADVREAVVMADSIAAGRTVRELDLRRNHRLNLLAVARRGHRLKNRPGDILLQPGDVLLLQELARETPAKLSSLGFLPITDQHVRLGKKRKVFLAIGLFAGGLISASLGFVPVEIALTSVAGLMVLAGLISPREVYTSIDWPVIVLLAAILPVAGALESSGGADSIARLLVGMSDHLPAVAMLSIILVGSMLLANLVNKAAPVLMAPIALSVAAGLGASPDAFLMAVAVGTSSAFLTPVGHASNALVMGPGGYQFSDYWRLGLPLSVLVTVVGIPLILYFWPL